MFDHTRILRLATALILSGALLAVTPVTTAGLFAEGDDEIPGVVSTSPTEGAFVGTDDVHDIFRVKLSAGEIFRAVLHGTMMSDIDLSLISPDTTRIDDALAVAFDDRPSGAYPVRFSYEVDDSGTYYLDVFSHAEALVDEAEYTVFWTTDRPGDTGEMPGVALPDSPFSGMLDNDIDQDDVYSVYLAAGDQLDFQLDSDSGADFELYLFGPAATSVDRVGEAVARSDTPGGSEQLTYVASTSGTYHVNAYTREGSGAYRVSWAKKAALSTPVVASSMSLGRTYKASGAISVRTTVRKTVARLQAYRWESGKWVLRKTQAASVVRSSGHTKYTAQVRLPYRGKWRLRAYHRDASHSASYSAFRYVTVR